MTTYDLIGALDTLFPGLVVQDNLIDAAAARYAAKGAPLDGTDVPAILSAANALDQTVPATQVAPTTPAQYPTSLPSYPTGLPRFPDSNESARDGWSIANQQQVVNG